MERFAKGVAAATSVSLKELPLVAARPGLGRQEG